MADWTGAVKGEARTDNRESHPIGSNAICETILRRQDVLDQVLAGKWASNTMDGHVKSLDGNQYAKIDAGLALKSFIMEFGGPKDLTIDGSKEHNSKGTQFMKGCRRNNNQITRTEPERPPKSELCRRRYSTPKSELCRRSNSRSETALVLDYD
jgi:hypothetical protein